VLRPRLGGPRPGLDYESHAIGLDRNELGALLVAPRTARAIDLAIGERCQGPILLTLDGRRLDRHGTGGSFVG
jgi:hypothetical protein